MVLTHLQANGVTYTVTAQTAGAYGFVRSYSGTALKVIKGVGSADFTTSSVHSKMFLNFNDSARTLATVSSVSSVCNYCRRSKIILEKISNADDNTEEITVSCRWSWSKM